MRAPRATATATATTAATATIRATTRARATARATAGAVLRSATLGDGDDAVALVSDATGTLRAVRGNESDARACALRGLGASAATRGPFWSMASAGAANANGTARALVGTSGKHLATCVVDARDGGETIEVRAEGDALGPHTGYVRDVATTRDGRTAWSCACNFAPKWTRDEDGTWTAAAARETLRLFTGDILRLCVLEDGDDVTVFCGVADGTVRAFDASTTTPRDLGAVGGDASATRGRVSALCVVDGRWLVSGSHDGRVLVHDARTPSSPAVAEIERLDGKVHDILALDDGRVLVAGEFGIEVFENAPELAPSRGDEDDEEMFGRFRSLAIRALAKTSSRLFVGAASGEVTAIRLDRERRSRSR